MMHNTHVKFRSSMIALVKWFILISYCLALVGLHVSNDDLSVLNRYASTTTETSNIFVSALFLSPSLHRTKLVSCSSVQRIQSLFSQSRSDDSEAIYREDAKKFVDALMNAVEIDIPDSNGMKVLRSIPLLEVQDVKDIVIRNITDDFWMTCINLVDDPETKRCVAVGSPGIGKSTSVPLLIRKLLKDRKTVVYIVKSERQVHFYCEFVPGEGNSVTINTYPESWAEFAIPSLRLDTTYYIVDPAKYSGSCDPSSRVQAKVIIAASPDEKHWGGSEFEKERTFFGVFQYYPLWSLDELLFARETICPDMSAAEVIEGYRLFGGVPRNVFNVKGRERLLASQENCVKLLTVENARKIARGDFQATGIFSAGAPKSAVLGFVRAEEEKTPFSVGVSTIISAHVADLIRIKFISDLYGYATEFAPEGYKIIESYCRSILVGKKEMEFTCRRNGPTGSETKIKLGGCRRVSLVVDPVAEAVKRNPDIPFVLFHSTNRCYALIDFLYKDMNGHFHAFQVTRGETHTANVTHIKRLEAKVGGASNLSLYYLVLDSKYASFKTNLRDPNANGATCNIWVVMIKRPNELGDIESAEAE